MTALTAKTPIYPYASGPLLEERNRYFYTPYLGQILIEGWREQRLAAARQGAVALSTAGCDTPKTPIDGLLNELWHKFPSPTAYELLAKLLQRFEVSKRLHDAYTPAWRPAEGAGHQGFERYLSFAELLARAYEQDGLLPWLNGLLKCLDTLCAYQPQLNATQASRLNALISAEQLFIARLQKTLIEPAGHA